MAAFLRLLRSDSDSIATGVLLGVLAALIWGAWPVVTRFGVHQTLNSYDVTALRFATVGLVLLPVFMKRGVQGIGWPKATVLASGAGLLALLFYSRAVKIMGAARGALFAALVPGTTVLLAYPVLGETPNVWELSGLVVVSAGMFYALGLNRLITTRG